MELRIGGGREKTEIARLRQEIQRLADAVERLDAGQRAAAERVEQLRTTVGQAARETDKERRKLLQQFDAARWTDAKWRKIFNNQISALVRRICLPLDKLAPPYDLNAKRFRLRSQNEEDGILFALLDYTGWGGRRFVEIGSGKSGGSSAALARDCGWSGLMIELSAAAVELARRKLEGNRGVTVIAARVTPGNVDQLLEAHGSGGDVDVLAIDIDSYDYWVFSALTVARPRVLVLEYNALFGPTRRVTIPCDQPLEDTPKGYHGASLAALTALAESKGYRLVTCENTGVNAFFLREDVAPEVGGVPAIKAFMPLRSRVEIDDGIDITKDIYTVIEARGLPLAEV